MLLSLCNSVVGEIVSNALLKSNCMAIVISRLSNLDLTSSVSLVIAVAVLWCFRKPAWRESRIPWRVTNSKSWSWTSFSRTLELRSAIVRKSEGDDGSGNVLLCKDVINILTRKLPIGRRALATTLCGIPYPLACVVWISEWNRTISKDVARRELQ